MPPAPATAVLILAEEPVVAALIGMLVELAGRTPVFADSGEAAPDAIRRVRPAMVVLIDLALDDARSDLLFTQLARRRVSVALFAPVAKRLDVARAADDRGIPWFTVPSDVARVTEVLDRAESTEWWKKRSGPSPLVFRDREGERWTIYDRRRSNGGRAGGDRRTPVAEVVDRTFVSERGRRLSCEVPVVEAEDPSPEVLERQLDRAVPVAGE